MKEGSINLVCLMPFCEDHDIIYEVTPPYSPKSNRLTKRKNRILKGMMNAMLISFGVLMNLLGGGGGGSYSYSLSLTK